MSNLKEARTLKGFTQQEVSKRTKIPLSTLRRYERGTNDPDSKALMCLAKLYGVSCDYLLDYSTTKDNKERNLINDYRLLTDEHKIVAVKVVSALKQMQER